MLFIDFLFERNRLDKEWIEKINSVVWNTNILYFQAESDHEDKKIKEKWINSSIAKFGKSWCGLNPSIPIFEQWAIDNEFEYFVENLDWIFCEKLRIVIYDTKKYFVKFEEGVKLISEIELHE